VCLFLPASFVHAQCAPDFAFFWGSQGSGPGQFQTPVAVAVDHARYLYVTDEGNNRVQKFQAGGTDVSDFYTGQDSNPTGITIDASDMMYVALYHIHCVDKYTTNGTWIRRFGTPGSLNNPVAYPIGVGVDASGFVYVGSTGNFHIQKY